MDKFARYFFIAIGLNTLIFSLLLIPFFHRIPKYIDPKGWGPIVFITMGVSLFVQGIIGTAFISTDNTKQKGKAMLVAAVLFAAISVFTLSRI